MATSLAKEFENKFVKQWLETFPNTFCLRLHDQVSGYKNVSRNPCDYICFNNKKLFLMECKTHKGNAEPFTDMPQYDLLINYANMENVIAGFVIWFYEKDKIVFCPIQNAIKIKESGEKSIHLIKHKDYLIEIPSIKKRVYMESDYSVLIGENI